MRTFTLACCVLLLAGTTVLALPAAQQDEPLLGADECTFGPSHWCSHQRVAEKCNAANYCAEHKLGYLKDSNTNNNNAPDPQNLPAGPIVGADECTYGPTHWCSHQKIAQKCKTESYCAEHKLGYTQQ